MAACKSTSEQGKRDAKGRFQPGQSGNPSGRPAGLSCRAILAAREWAESTGLPMLMAAAEDGDLDACRFLVALGIPRQKPVSLPEPLPQTGGEGSSPARQNLAEQARGVLAAASSGEITSDTAGALMSLLVQAAKIEEITELREQVATLARLLENRG